MNERLTVTAFTDNSPGVLHRIVVAFTRRKVNIESLTVSETEQVGISRFTIVVKSPFEAVQKIARQIDRIIEVREVYVSRDSDIVFKEIAFFKIATDSASKRAEIEDLAHRYDAKVTYAEKEFLVLEKTGDEDSISSLFLVLESFGIKEFVRSGRISILKHERKEEEVVESVIDARTSNMMF